jgi:hypothetical protein
MSDDIPADTGPIDAQLQLTCDKGGHHITTLIDAGHGVIEYIDAQRRRRTLERDGGVFDMPCPDCGGKLYGRSVESLTKKLSEVPKGTVSEWTLLFYELTPE